MKRILGILLLAASAGCGVILPLVKNKSALQDLRLSMSQAQVQAAIGSPDEVRGSVVNVDGQTVAVWQYNLHDASDAGTAMAVGLFTATLFWWWPTQGQGYWLYFVEDTLVQWGRAGDWRPELIANITLRTNGKE